MRTMVQKHNNNNNVDQCPNPGLNFAIFSRKGPTHAVYKTKRPALHKQWLTLLWSTNLKRLFLWRSYNGKVVANYVWL